MKRLAALPLLLLLSACVTARPVTAHFPEAPDTLKEPCEELRTLARDAKLSDLMITITENYVRYHECKRKNQGWLEWYNEQKAIYDAATK